MEYVVEHISVAKMTRSLGMNSFMTVDTLKNYLLKESQSFWSVTLQSTSTQVGYLNNIVF